MQKFRKWIYSLCILTGLLAVCTACGKADSQPKEETTEVVTDGPRMYSMAETAKGNW